MKELITDRGFTDYFDAEGVQKFTGGVMKWSSSDSAPADAARALYLFLNGT